MGPNQILPLRVEVDLRKIAMKTYYTFPRSPEIKSYYSIQFKPGHSFVSLTQSAWAV